MHADRRTRMTSWNFADNSRTIVLPLTEYDSDNVREIEGRRRGLWLRRTVNEQAGQDEELQWNRGQRAAPRNGKPGDVLDRGERVRVEPFGQVEDEWHRPRAERGDGDTAGRVRAAVREINPSEHAPVLNRNVRPTDRNARFPRKVLHPELVDHRVVLERS